MTWISAWKIWTFRRRRSQHKTELAVLSCCRLHKELCDASLPVLVNSRWTAVISHLQFADHTEQHIVGCHRGLQVHQEYNNHRLKTNHRTWLDYAPSWTSHTNCSIHKCRNMSREVNRSLCEKGAFGLSNQHNIWVRFYMQFAFSQFMQSSHIIVVILSSSAQVAERHCSSTCSGNLHKQPNSTGGLPAFLCTA